MSVFILKNNIVQINTDFLVVPEFKELWDRDKSKTKERAYKELSYAYFMADYKSPYNVYPEDQREEAILKDFIRDAEWKPDDLVKQAVNRYIEFQDTPTLRLVRAARKAVEKLIIFFETEGTDHKSFTSNLKELGNITKSLDMLEEKTKKEQTSEERIRGGGEIKTRER